MNAVCLKPIVNKPWPNEPNIVTQHCSAHNVGLVWPPCWVVLDDVGRCSMKFESSQAFSPTSSNIFFVLMLDRSVWPHARAQARLFRSKHHGYTVISVLSDVMVHDVGSVWPPRPKLSNIGLTALNAAEHVLCAHIFVENMASFSIVHVIH